MSDIVNIVYFLIGAAFGGIIVWFIIRNQIEKEVSKRNIKIAQLEAANDTEENIKSAIRDIATEATKPIVDDITTRQSNLQIKFICR